MIALPLPAKPPAAPVTALGAFDTSLLKLINGRRVAGGLVPVKEALGLNTVSGSWSTTLSTRGRYGTMTDNPNVAAQTLASGASTRTIYSETTAKWYPSSVSPATTFALLVSNAVDLGRIMTPAYRYVGIKTVVAAEGTSFNTLTFTDKVDAGQAVDPAAAFSPIGQLTGASESGSTLRLQGRIADPDAAAAVQLRFTDVVNATAVTTVVAAAAGSFDAILPISTFGTHTVCVTAVNQGVGYDADLGCTTAAVGGLTGHLEAATAALGSVALVGWAIDPDQPAAPVAVRFVAHSAAGDTVLGQTSANGARPDIAAQVPGTGSSHGYDLVFTAPAGAQTICAVGTAARTAEVTELGCADVSVWGALIGSLDTVKQSADTLAISGWDVDRAYPGTAIQVAIRITGPAGTSNTTVLAANPRADVLKAFPAFGAAHGYLVSLPSKGTGPTTVCATIIPVSPLAPSKALACKSIGVTATRAK